CSKSGAKCKHLVAAAHILLAEGALEEPTAPAPAPTCAAAWLSGLDLTAVKQHLAEAAVEDAQAELPATTFRVVGCCRRTGRSKSVREGLSRSDAEALRRKMVDDPLVKGFAVWIQCDSEPLPW